MTPSTPKSDSSQQTTEHKHPISTRVRVVQVVFLTIAVGITMGMAYWQFSRWDTTNSWQNLGYAFQWPAFGIFFIWAYRKYMEYEKERAAGTIDAAYVVPEGTMTEIPDDFLPESKAATVDVPTDVDDRRSARRNGDVDGSRGTEKNGTSGNSAPDSSDH